MAENATGWWISSDGSGRLTSHFRRDIASEELGEGGLRLAIHHSALNYKDALALTGAPGVLRTTPLIPGIDAAGIIETSDSPDFPVGTRVVVTGFGYGEDRHGGLATHMVASPEHVVRIPANLDTAQAAALGTAGITALVAVQALRDHGINPDNQTLPIAVTGAAGALGSLAVYFLARQGFAVTAITGRTDEADYLRLLGATQVLSRQEILALPDRPLLPERFEGVLDQAGGALLARLLASTRAGGVVAASGLAGGTELPTTVLPFILRGITLVGINSVHQSLATRHTLWGIVAEHADTLPFGELVRQVPLERARDVAPHVLGGVTRGRVVVQVQV